MTNTNLVNEHTETYNVDLNATIADLLVQVVSDFGFVGGLSHDNAYLRLDGEDLNPRWHIKDYDIQSSDRLQLMKE